MAFLPGGVCSEDGSAAHAVRLTFSALPVDRLREGARRLACHGRRGVHGNQPSDRRGRRRGRPRAAVLDHRGPPAPAGLDRRPHVERLGHRSHRRRGPDHDRLAAGPRPDSQLFLDEGDLLLCESPTYLADLQSFQVFGPRCLGVPTDDQGLDLDALERQLDRERPKLVYVIPNAQNPSGRTWSVERRRAFVDLITRHELPVIEDAAYGDVIFDGAIPPALKAFDTRGLVVTLGTFSKILCPGLRLGWVAASPELREKYVILKQSTDLHTPTLTQMLAARWLQSADFDANLARIRALYRERRDVMVAALESELPGLRFTRPAGGLFVWLQLPEGVDARELLKRCLERQVAFVPGGSFFAGEAQHNTARLNFSAMPPERIREGIRRLAAALRELTSAAQPRLPELASAPAR